MSELKEQDARELIVNNHYCPNEENLRVYPKSEADKVIARHKYKRCLAMARWCAAEYDVYNLIPRIEKMGLYRKWHKRWLELAEKFKEAK